MGFVPGPVAGKIVALVIWSKDGRKMDVEDGLEFFCLRAGKGGLPCSSELVDPAPFITPAAFLPGLLIRSSSLL